MNWQEALEQAWSECSGQPVAFGKFDCCQFVDRYGELLTGIRHGAQYSYASLREAKEIIDSNGSLEALFRVILGEPAEPQPGCVVVFDLAPDIECAGVLTDYCIVFVHPTEGVARITAEARTAWLLK